LDRADNKVTIVIPHFNGEEILRRCIISLQETEYKDFCIVVVDNGSTDRSVDMVRSSFPDVVILENHRNMGFAAGCNTGIRFSSSPFVVLLNNDTEVTPGWLGPLLEAAEKDELVAAVQPKLLSLREPDRFDYCGGAGGELDIFGYPYVWGRLFNTIEKDRGQYDSKRRIFWASGAAILLRRSSLDRVGLLDEDFFAHMEEIDLCWRLHWAGYKVVFVPQSVVFHSSGATLNEDSIRKMVLNHRNSIIMILKNHTAGALIWILPFRIILEIITAASSFFIKQPKRSFAVLRGMFGVVRKIKTVLAGRRAVRSLRCIPESLMFQRMYRKSIAIAYFIKGIRRACDL